MTTVVHFSGEQEKAQHLERYKKQLESQAKVSIVSALCQRP